MDMVIKTLRRDAAEISSTQTHDEPSESLRQMPFTQPPCTSNMHGLPSVPERIPKDVSDPSRTFLPRTTPEGTPRYDVRSSPTAYAYRNTSRIPFNPESPRATQQGLSSTAPQSHTGKPLQALPGIQPLETRPRIPPKQAQPGHAWDSGVPSSVYSQPSQTSQLPFVYPDALNASSMRPSEMDDLCVPVLEEETSTAAEWQQNGGDSTISDTPTPSRTSPRELDHQGYLETTGGSTPASDGESFDVMGPDISPPGSWVERGLHGSARLQGSFTSQLMERGSTVTSQALSQQWNRSLLLSSTSGSVPVDFCMPFEQQMWTLAENSALLSDPNLPQSTAAAFNEALPGAAGTSVHIQQSSSSSAQPSEETSTSTRQGSMDQQLQRRPTGESSNSCLLYTSPSPRD